MTTHHTSRSRAELNLNHLRRGAIYRARTSAGTSIGEYLGMEYDYGSRALLLRNATGTDSIDRRHITSIELIAA